MLKELEKQSQIIKFKYKLKKLAIITTHPIQYNAPIFKLLSERKNVQIKVFYTWEDSKNGIFDKNFGRNIKWDIPLLEGYDYQFVKNTSKEQGTHHFKGMINPDLNIEIVKWGANAVLIFGWSFQSHFSAMRYFKKKIPIYFRGDSTLIDEIPGLKTILRRLWLKFVYHYVDYAFYVGTNNKNYYLKHGLTEKQLIFAPHAIENERFYDNEGVNESLAKAWKKELGIEDEDLVFLYAGKFIKKKDPLILLNAANQLNKDKFKFIFAGNGELENRMEKLATDNKNIKFLPFQNQSKMPILYRLGDVFVLPSKGPNETWGLAVNEAMASGKAILVSDKVGCAIDLVKNGENGYVFKALEINSLIEKINCFNKDNILRLCENSKKTIDEFNFENIATAIEIRINQI